MRLDSSSWYKLAESDNNVVNESENEMNIISEQYWKSNSQSTIHAIVVLDHPNIVPKLRIQIDPTREVASAKIEAWTNGSWNLVHKIYLTDSNKPQYPHTRGVEREDFQPLVTELVRVAQAILV